MSTIQILFGFLLGIISIFLILMVMLQESASNELNVISGASQESYYGKNKGRTSEATLANFTKISAILFILLTIIINATTALK